jgi:cephalosporin hydroxylase
MKLTVDTEAASLVVEDGHGVRRLPLYGPEAFALVSDLWLKTGWALRYSYGFSWLGRPVIQLPEDLVRIQEVIHRLEPDLLVETGVAHGGSLVFYATLFKAMGRGRVVGVDVDIRAPNREALDRHVLRPLITLIEGSSVDPATVAQVRASVRPGERVLVVLDSNHTKAHVAAELEAYGPLVTEGSYIVVTDGIMRDLAEVPDGRPEWRQDNPLEAAREFLARHPEFRPEEPAPPFNEGQVRGRITQWPGAFLRRWPAT